MKKHKREISMEDIAEPKATASNFNSTLNYGTGFGETLMLSTQ